MKQIVYYEQPDDGTTGMERTVDLDVKVYPNPAAEYVMYKSNGSGAMMNIEDCDMQGRLVKSLQSTNNIQWYAKNNVAGGLYNYVITIGDKQQSGQLVIK